LPCFILAGEGTTITQNIGHHLAPDTVAPLLWEPHNFAWCLHIPAPKFLTSCLNLVFKLCAKNCLVNLIVVSNMPP
jgi:hypothetical protein